MNCIGDNNNIRDFWDLNNLVYTTSDSKKLSFSESDTNYII